MEAPSIEQYLPVILKYLQENPGITFDIFVQFVLTSGVLIPEFLRLTPTLKLEIMNETRAMITSMQSQLPTVVPPVSPPRNPCSVLDEPYVEQPEPEAPVRSGYNLSAEDDPQSNSNLFKKYIREQLPPILADEVIESLAARNLLHRGGPYTPRTIHSLVRFTPLVSRVSQVFQSVRNQGLLESSDSEDDEGGWGPFYDYIRRRVPDFADDLISTLRGQDGRPPSRPFCPDDIIDAAKCTKWEEEVEQALESDSDSDEEEKIPAALKQREETKIPSSKNKEEEKVPNPSSRGWSDDHPDAGKICAICQDESDHLLYYTACGIAVHGSCYQGCRTFGRTCPLCVGPSHYFLHADNWGRKTNAIFESTFMATMGLIPQHMLAELVPQSVVPQYRMNTWNASYISSLPSNQLVSTLRDFHTRNIQLPEDMGYPVLESAEWLHQNNFPVPYVPIIYSHPSRSLNAQIPEDLLFGGVPVRVLLHLPTKNLSVGGGPVQWKLAMEVSIDRKLTSGENQSYFGQYMVGLVQQRAHSEGRQLIGESVDQIRMAQLARHWQENNANNATTVPQQPPVSQPRPLPAPASSVQRWLSGVQHSVDRRTIKNAVDRERTGTLNGLPGPSRTETLEEWLKRIGAAYTCMRNRILERQRGTQPIVLHNTGRAYPMEHIDAVAAQIEHDSRVAAAEVSARVTKNIQRTEQSERRLVSGRVEPPVTRQTAKRTFTQAQKDQRNKSQRDRRALRRRDKKAGETNKMLQSLRIGSDTESDDEDNDSDIEIVEVKRPKRDDNGDNHKPDGAAGLC